MFVKYQQYNARPYRDEVTEGDDAGQAEVTEAPAIPEDIQAQLAQMDEIRKENERLAAKLSEANKHAKAAERQAAAEAKAKAEAEGNYEQLYKSSEERNMELQNQIAEIQNSVANEKKMNVALQLASELAEGYNVDLLGEHIARRLKFVDNTVKVVDESGDLTVSSLEDLKKEFASSARYSSLLKGNQSSGGGATGGDSGGATSKTLTRSEFDALSPAAKMKFARTQGSQIID